MNNDHNKMFIKAVKSNMYDVVEALLRHDDVDPSYRDNFAIRWACGNGYVDIAELLLSDSRVDHTARENHALRLARENGHILCTILLTNV